MIRQVDSQERDKTVAWKLGPMESGLCDRFVPKLRIGIDIHSLGNRKGGNETYFEELAKKLIVIPCAHQWILYYTNAVARQRISSSGHVRLQLLYPRHPLLRIPFTLPWRTREDRLDVFHAQHIVPPFLKCKTVTTIPDIAYEHFPEAFPQYQRAWMKAIIRDSAKRADHIITVSEYSKQDIVRTYGIPEEKITVTYEGASEEFRPGDKQKAKEELDRKYGITGEFVLYLGRLQARKNLRRVVDAFAQVRKAGFSQKLVLAGKRDSLFEPVLSRIRELKLENDVILPGFLPADDVRLFYIAAEVFVYPSLYEGFGLPLVEAMACGLPVITSQGSSLEEVAAGAALFVDPLSETSIASAIQRMLEDSALRFRLRQAGLDRSKQFDFVNTARETMDVYEAL
jgi:glycosyltransferase involved in cell wall biosynthesis